MGAAWSLRVANAKVPIVRQTNVINSSRSGKRKNTVNEGAQDTQGLAALEVHPLALPQPPVEEFLLSTRPPCCITDGSHRQRHRLTLVCYILWWLFWCLLHMFLSRFRSDSSFPTIHRSQGPPFLWEHRIQTCSAVFNRENSEGELGAASYHRTSCPQKYITFLSFLPCAGLKRCKCATSMNNGYCRDILISCSLILDGVCIYPLL